MAKKKRSRIEYLKNLLDNVLLMKKHLEVVEDRANMSLFFSLLGTAISVAALWFSLY